MWEALLGRSQGRPGSGGSVWTGSGSYSRHGCGGASDGREKSQLLRSCVLPLRVRAEEM